MSAEIGKAEESIDRYLAAFEAGTLPEERCGQRVRDLSARIAELRERQANLPAAIEEASMQALTEAHLAGIRARIRPVVERGSDALRKALLAELVAEVKVGGRDSISTWFKVPAALNGAEPDVDEVRALSGLVPPGGVEPPSTG